MRRLICAFVVRIWHETHFFMARVTCTCEHISLFCETENLLRYHSSAKLKIYCDFVVKLLIDLVRITRFTYVSKINYLLYLFIFACIVLRKLHVHSLFTLETVGFPECLLVLDSDKQLNQLCSLLNFNNFPVHPLSEKFEKIILFVFIYHIVFYKTIPDR